ncbi:MAG: glucosamine-6-phosphate deaminase [Chloroflexi bacterium]|nr:glucosamine-6-phosphate deaminase [Chloroflexota bacterium]
MKRPHVIVETNYDAMSRRVAALIDAAIRVNPNIVLALPTGGTPIGTYAALVDLHRRTGTDWSRVTTFNLDEYLGVAPDHPESYAHFMQQHLFSGVNLPPERRHLPNGLAPDPQAEVACYEAAIEAAGGLDLAVLGVGTNGHLGFNEPGDHLTAGTHIATIAEDTWRRNFPHLAREVRPGQHGQPGRSGTPAERPFRQAYTMGIGTILQARAIILLAGGTSKRAILRAAHDGPVTTRNPASFLQLHRNVTLLLDREAGEEA